MDLKTAQSLVHNLPSADAQSVLHIVDLLDLKKSVVDQPEHLLDVALAVIGYPEEKFRLILEMKLKKHEINSRQATVILPLALSLAIPPAVVDFNLPHKRQDLFSAPQYSNSPDEEPQSQNREQIRDFQIQMSTTSATTSISISPFLIIPPKLPK